MKKKKWTAVLAVLFFTAAALSGCSHQASDVPSDVFVGTDTEYGSGTDSSEDVENAQGSTAGESTGESESTESEGTNSSGEADETLPVEEGASVQQKIVLATDIHYLAEELAGNRCQTFMSAVESSDGRVLQYGWEVLDAFIDDMLKEQPDLIILSGDLTMNGERQSHEELAEKLGTFTEHDIPVIVIPGNHDINNPYARKYTSDGTEKTDSITAEEFQLIYSDFGYVAADSRDPDSLSYLYKLDDYYWLLMLDSCQYDPVNRVGGMIRYETYEWMEEILDESWEKGAQVITVSHHNLLDQSGVSREFSDDCTIEHNEELIRMLEDYEVRLHLSGHLHLQHYGQDEDSGIYEVVTGSLVMAPCRYGLIKIWNDGTIQYDAVQTDVDGWAKRNLYKNRDLADFKTYSENFLSQVTYRNAILDLRKQTMDRRLFFSDSKMDEMARFYADLCVHYYGGRMYEIAETMKNDPAYTYWTEIDYISDLSDFLKNILEDEAKDFSHLKVPY